MRDHSFPNFLLVLLLSNLAVTGAERSQGLLIPSGTYETDLSLAARAVTWWLSDVMRTNSGGSANAGQERGLLVGYFDETESNGKRVAGDLRHGSYLLQRIRTGRTESVWLHEPEHVEPAGVELVIRRRRGE
jgi:hypothetical protein